MTIEEKEALAMLNDMGTRATAIRLRAAVIMLGMQQKDMAAAVGMKTNAFNAYISGGVYPSREVMKYLFRNHRIDFNFMLNGNFAQLPSDVQERLFPALEAAKSEWDQKAS